MYSRNRGSNWPRSGALIAASTRGCALSGPGPISSRRGGSRSSKSSAMRVVLQPVAGDVDATRHPDFLRTHVLEEPLQGSQASGPPHQVAVQADRHHAALFRVQHVQAVLQVVEEIVARVEALGGGEAHVVCVEDRKSTRL